MDLAFVDNLAKQNNGIKYLLVAVDVFLRFVTVKQGKQNMLKTFCMLSKKIVLKKTLLKNFELIKEQNMENFQIILQRERH